MSNISLVEAKLPPGFRFHPRDDELVCDYLLKKMILENSNSLLLIEVDLNKCEPWDIPDTACVGGKEWYFYSQRDRKYATGLRTNRATATGYWKATGKDRSIYRKGSLVGMRKTLVFYQGRAPKGRKTEWVMHEFRLEGPLGPPKVSSHKEDWVLCRVFFKNRELAVAGKPGAASCYDLDRGTSSLPPLMDSYITFDQPHNNSDINSEYDEQVPCFSIFSQQQHPNPSIFPQSDQVGLLNNLVPLTTRHAAIAADMGSSCNYDDAFNSLSDKKVLKAVLNQLTKMEEQNPSNVDASTSLGEGSSESYLSEVGMPHMWSHY